jgi:RNase P/RNase MRP subunit p29
VEELKEDTDVGTAPIEKDTEEAEVQETKFRQFKIDGDELSEEPDKIDEEIEDGDQVDS